MIAKPIKWIYNFSVFTSYFYDFPEKHYSLLFLGAFSDPLTSVTVNPIPPHALTSLLSISHLYTVQRGPLVHPLVSPLEPLFTDGEERVLVLTSLYCLKYCCGALLKNIQYTVYTLLKMPLQPRNFPRYKRDFSLLYQGKNLFPNIQANFTLYIRYR